LFEGPLEPKLKGLFIWGSGGCTDNHAVPTLPTSFCPLRGTGRWRKALGLLLWAGLALSPAGGHGKDKDRGGDHERARDALQASEVLPLATLLEQLRRSHPGQVLEIEIDREDGRLIYEVKLLHANGQLLKLELDAATGQVLKVKRRDK
jgi:Peptidase propeptide and YPEB domain